MRHDPELLPPAEVEQPDDTEDPWRWEPWAVAAVMAAVMVFGLSAWVRLFMGAR